MRDRALQVAPSRVKTALNRPAPKGDPAMYDELASVPASAGLQQYGRQAGRSGLLPGVWQLRAFLRSLVSEDDFLGNGPVFMITVRLTSSDGVRSWMPRKPSNIRMPALRNLPDVLRRTANTQIPPNSHLRPYHMANNTTTFLLFIVVAATGIVARRRRL
jgi:hypothetical protein